MKLSEYRKKFIAEKIANSVIYIYTGSFLLIILSVASIYITKSAFWTTLGIMVAEGFIAIHFILSGGWAVLTGYNRFGRGLPYWTKDTSDLFKRMLGLPILIIGVVMLYFCVYFIATIVRIH